MERRIVVAGFGGQGVLTLGVTIALNQMNKGLYSTWIPSYGAEQRGGTANCAVIYSDEEIGSPFVSKNIDILIAASEPALKKFEGGVKSAGIILIDSSIIKTAPSRKDVDFHYINATDIASNIGNTKVVNVVLLGAYAKITGDFSREEIFETLKSKLKGKDSLFAINQEALNIGYKQVI